MSYEQIKLMAEKIIIEARVAHADYDFVFSVAFSECVKDKASQYKAIEGLLGNINNGLNGEQYTGYTLLTDDTDKHYCNFFFEIDSSYSPKGLKEAISKALAKIKTHDGENTAFIEFNDGIQNYEESIGNIIINAKKIELLHICENGLVYPSQSACDPYTDLIKRITDCYYYTQDEEGGISPSLLKYHVA
jgi:hypothetical protein